MEFKNEEFIEREIKIAGYLKQGFSSKDISEKTGLSKKILTAHLRNMMKKLKVASLDELKKLIKEKEQ